MPEISTNETQPAASVPESSTSETSPAPASDTKETLSTQSLAGGEPSADIQNLENTFQSQGYTTSQSQTLSTIATALALKNAGATQEVLDKIKAGMDVDKNSPAAQLSNGNIPQGNSAFDKALQNLLAKGVPVDKAMQQAMDISQSLQVAQKVDLVDDQISNLSSEQMSFMLNLLQKGVSKQEAASRAQSFVQTKETSSGKMTEGEIESVSAAYDIALTKLLQTYPPEIAMKLAKSVATEAQRFQEIDENIAQNSLMRLMKEEKIVDSKIFNQLLMNNVEELGFEKAFEKAMSIYRGMEKNYNSNNLLTLIAENGKQQQLNNLDKLYLALFLKELFSGTREDVATAKAQSLIDGYKEKFTYFKTIDANLNQNIKKLITQE